MRIQDNIIFIIAAIFILSLSCGGGTDPKSVTPAAGTTTTATTTITTSTTAPASITLTANPSSVTTGGTSSISAAVKTSTNANVSDGTSVSFSLSSSTLGTITSLATTYNGTAIATFTAGTTTAGTVTVTAKAGDITQTTNIAVSAPTTGSIEFVSATPQVIGIKGGGQTETSSVKFLVKDINGTAVLDGVSVSFSMIGPSGGRTPQTGGEYIGDMDSTPTTASASTVSGYATVSLHSGNVAGPVTITASVTVSTQTLTSSATQISIGGGAPSATHYNLSTSKFNLPGLALSNQQATITAYIADRFGNYNILTGTSVSFYTEAGAVDRSNVTDSTGLTTVTLRTQAPDPAEVAISSSETTAINTLNTTYLTPAGSLSTAIPTDDSYHPRDGWVTVLSTVLGEEAFNDANGNGLYDSGESFTDLVEPFYDKNDDGCRNDGSTKNCSDTVSASTDPFEEYIDANGNGSYDGPNGVWDGPGCSGSGCQSSKVIWTSITLVFTGHCYYAEIAPATFDIANGASQSFSFMVGDRNVNRLVSGTTISVLATKGTLSGTTSYTVPDGLSSGPTEIGFYLADADTDTTADPSVITITVSPPSLSSCYKVISGTVK